MGSDFTYADMSEMVGTREADHTLLGRERFNGFDCYVVESVPRTPGSSAYGRTVSWIDSGSFLAVRVLFYRGDGETLHKEMVCEELGQEGEQQYTKKVVMESKSDGHRTILEILQARFLIPLNPGYFTTTFLETGKVR